MPTVEEIEAELGELSSEQTHEHETKPHIPPKSKKTSAKRPVNETTPGKARKK